MLDIQVGYKLVEAADWHLVRLDAADYFRRDAARAGADLQVGSQPQHNHVAELLPPDILDRLQYAFTRVSDALSGTYYECAYHFWGSANDYVCLVTHHLESGTRRELIFLGSLPFRAEGTQVIRIGLDEPMPRLTMNCFMWGPGGDAESLDMLKQAG